MEQQGDKKQAKASMQSARKEKFTKQLLIASSGHQVPRKAAHCLRREVGQKY